MMNGMEMTKELILRNEVLVGNCLLDVFYTKSTYRSQKFYWGEHIVEEETEEILFVQNDVVLGAAVDGEPISSEEMLDLPDSTMCCSKFTAEDSQHMLEALDQSQWKFYDIWYKED